jgi:hypothetical protein
MITVPAASLVLKADHLLAAIATRLPPPDEDRPEIVIGVAVAAGGEGGGAARHERRRRSDEELTSIHFSLCSSKSPILIQQSQEASTRRTGVTNT